MELVRLNLASKNNKQNGFYLYIPIIKIDASFYFGESIKSSTILKKENIDVGSIFVKRQIPNKFLSANGINL